MSEEIFSILQTPPNELSYVFADNLSPIPINPVLQVEGCGVVPLPLVASVAQALELHCVSSKFGLGTATVLDPAVRNSLEIAHSKITFGNPKWAAAIQSVADEAANCLLGGSTAPVKAELWRLILYKPGSFFKPHTDSEKVKGMFATLVVSLPCVERPEGGDLVVRHGTSEAIMGKPTLAEAATFAFFASCQHEVKVLTTGLRLVLVYNLCFADQSFPIPQLGNKASHQVDLLRKHLLEADSKLCLPLEHEYSDAAIKQMGVRALKGGDMAIVQLLIKTNACELLVGVIDKYESAEAGGGWYGGDEEVMDSSVELKKLVPLYGDMIAPLVESTMETCEDEWAPGLDDALADGEYDTKDHGPTGNEGHNVEHWYAQRVLVILPDGANMALAKELGVEDEYYEAALSKLGPEAIIERMSVSALVALPEFDDWVESHLDALVNRLRKAESLPLSDHLMLLERLRPALTNEQLEKALPQLRPNMNDASTLLVLKLLQGLPAVSPGKQRLELELIARAPVSALLALPDEWITSHPGEFARRCSQLLSLAERLPLLEKLQAKTAPDTFRASLMSALPLIQTGNVAMIRRLMRLLKPDDAAAWAGVKSALLQMPPEAPVAECLNEVFEHDFCVEVFDAHMRRPQKRTFSDGDVYLIELLFARAATAMTAAWADKFEQLAPLTASNAANYVRMVRLFPNRAEAFARAIAHHPVALLSAALDELKPDEVSAADALIKVSVDVAAAQVDRLGLWETWIGALGTSVHGKRAYERLMQPILTQVRTWVKPVKPKDFSMHAAINMPGFRHDLVAFLKNVTLPSAIFKFPRVADAQDVIAHLNMLAGGFKIEYVTGKTTVRITKTFGNYNVQLNKWKQGVDIVAKLEAGAKKRGLNVGAGVTRSPKQKKAKVEAEVIDLSED